MMPRLGWILIVLTVLVGAAGLDVYYHVYRVAPVTQIESAEDHFLYGSIGNEQEHGVPYWIWLVLPRIFPDYLPTPGGYASIGALARGGREMPIGFSKVEIGVPRVGVNCAFCHTASVRATPIDPPMIYPGGPAHQTGADEYTRFLVAAASDPRFTSGTILGEIAKNVRLPLLEQLRYRFLLIPQTRRALRRLGDGDHAAAGPSTASGRGRADLVGRAKFGILQQSADAAVGAADNMPLWHLRSREAAGYQWDRSATSLREAVRAAAVLAGAAPQWLDNDTQLWERPESAHPSSLRRVMDYLGDLTPPKYPFAINAALAASGSAVYAANCAQCHDANGTRANTAIPPAEIGTDRHRLDAWTPGAAADFNGFYKGHDWQFSGFRAASVGYVAPSLDGVWLNAPYLHNGSVPALGDLLEPPASRPTRFWRGYDVYDQARVGFVSDGQEAQRLGTAFDVAAPGNGNGGHDYGTTLSSDDKRALLEYLKTR
ncbi:MAG: c-type cytochrome [Vicinamibacterales bacterium]